VTDAVTIRQRTKAKNLVHIIVLILSVNVSK